MPCRACNAPVSGRLAYCDAECRASFRFGGPRACDVCGARFTPLHASQHLCSFVCVGQMRRRGTTIPCVQCGAAFYKPAGAPVWRRFCSVKCCNAWQGRNKIDRVCTGCGCTFKVSPSSVRHFPCKFCSIKCYYASDDFKKNIIAAHLIQQTTSPTSIEIIGNSILQRIGIPFETQWSINDKFLVDAFLPSIRTVVQFDGDYWHGRPRRFKTLDKRQRQRVALDKSQDAYMRKCGYRVIRVWGSALEQSPRAVENRLRRMML